MALSLNIHEAIIFATLKHQKQKRKGTEIPYIVHPMEVMQILSAEGLPEEIVIAGILHDTLEDTDTNPEEIEQKFGKAVLDIVLTESEDKSKTWRERKQHTIDCLKKDTMATKLVCCADKLSNIKSMYADFLSIGEKLWQRFNAPKEDIKWYYESIVNALKDLASYKMYEELKATVEAVFGDKFEKIKLQKLILKHDEGACFLFFDENQMQHEYDFTNGAFVDLHYLAASCFEPIDGEDGILTCGCGASGCAGFFYFHSEITDDEIRWNLNNGKDLFRFNKEQYICEVNKTIEYLMTLCEKEKSLDYFPGICLGHDDICKLYAPFSNEAAYKTKD
ncbi:MAG: bifunctional (p)ppGpp synthetase/guanosine-3',5'-bis(diphosphate) 3'-pyrophosphohydrolase [Treponema sp.]|nr:bifunctional (p)ppGpp synthetase/guanosine-3',5'-bis(diphosphate) 3'-pyrophosphohydrolase [Treponema sp.]